MKWNFKLSSICTLALLTGGAWAQDSCVIDQQNEWLIGQWRGAEGTTEFLERWKVDADGEFRGYAESRSTESGEVYTYENMRLVERDGSTYYEAEVEQNEVVSFLLVECTADSVKFENKEHDFPNYIEYTFSGPESFKARISDLQNNGFELEFKKVMVD